MEMLIQTLIISLLLSLFLTIATGGESPDSSTKGGGGDVNPQSDGTQQLSSRIVNTKYGSVSGTIVHLDNRHLEPVEVFRGIPYASPPVGSLRFMPPVTGALWSGVKKADQ